MFLGSFKISSYRCCFFWEKKLQRNLAANFTTSSVTRRFFGEQKTPRLGPWDRCHLGKWALRRNRKNGHFSPPFIRFIHGSIKSKWIILKCATLSMEKFIPNHIQSTSKSSLRFLVHFFFFPNSDVSNLPNKKSYFHEFSSHRSYQTSGVDVVSTWPPKKKKKSPNCQGTIEAAIEAGRFCSQGFFAGPTLWANST